MMLVSLNDPGSGCSFSESCFCVAGMCVCSPKKLLDYVQLLFHVLSLESKKSYMVFKMWFNVLSWKLIKEKQEKVNV